MHSTLKFKVSGKYTKVLLKKYRQILKSIKNDWKIPKSTEKYRNVLTGTDNYYRVLEGSEKYLIKGTEKYWQVLENTGWSRDKHILAGTGVYY